MVYNLKRTLASISPTQSVDVLYFQKTETQGGTIAKLEGKRVKEEVFKKKKYEVGTQRRRVRYGGGKGEVADGKKFMYI